MNLQVNVPFTDGQRTKNYRSIKPSDFATADGQIKRSKKGRRKRGIYDSSTGGGKLMPRGGTWPRFASVLEIHITPSRTLSGPA